jgi:large subunit ribosomal protein L32e
MSTAKKVSGALARKRVLRKTTPRFGRHAAHRKARLTNNQHWKKPRGLHNKQKDNKRGSLPKVSDGYRTPVEVRGLHISGLAIKRVSNLSDLEGVNPATTGVVIASIGAKKQLAILHECAKHKIRVLNHKADARIKQLEKTRIDKQAALEEARQKKASKHTTTKTGKKAVDEKLSEEEKKEEQDKIKEEVLTKGN